MRQFIEKSRASAAVVDWWFVGAVLFLIGLGLLAQYSIGQHFSKQLVIAIIGLVGFAAITVGNYRVIKTHAALYVIVAVLLLIAVLLFGTTVRGTTGWFIIGGASFQPVEFVKLLFILFMAAYVEKDPALLQQKKYAAITGVVTLILCGLIFLQPDLGSAFIIFSIWCIFLIALKSPKWIIGTVIAGVIVSGLIGWFFIFQDYQKERLTTFLHAENDPLGAGYNISQSIVAIGSGSFWGRGLGFGTQSQLHFLPEASSDFIFAVIAEEFGFLGITVLFVAFGILFFRLWVWMSQVKDNYSFLLILGTVGYLGVQSILVIGMNLGVLPVTGVPLPLLSAGGSSLVMTILLLGIAHAAGRPTD